MAAEAFWRTKKLDEMNAEEWESLCDGCARCCLQKLENEDTGEVFYTQVVCHLLDQSQCRCTDYPNREVKAPGCVTLTPDRVRDFHWLPDTCAYRLVSEGKALPEWHPLLSGSRESIHQSGISVKGKVIPDTAVEQENWEEHIIEWVQQ